MKLKNFFSWQPPTDSACLELMRESFVHGLKYIGENGAIMAQRLFWTFMILASTMVLLYLVDEGVFQPLSSTVLIAMQTEDVTVQQIPFPAVTICNGNKVKYSKLVELTQVIQNYNSSNNESYPSSELAAILYLYNYCGTSASFVDAFDNKTWTFGEEHRFVDGTDGEFWKFAYPAFSSCEEMLLKCIWNEQNVPCHDLFRPILTELGMCCVFNLMPFWFLLKPRPVFDENFTIDSLPEELQSWLTWNIDCDLVELRNPKGWCRKGKNNKSKANILNQYPRKQKDPGVETGLTVLLNPQLDELNTYCKNIDSEGLRIHAHSPISYPHVRDFGKTIIPNSENFVSLQSTITTVEDDNVLNIPLEKRKCYYAFEKELDIFATYTQENCMDECVSSLTISVCKCFLYYMPVRINDSTTSMCLTKDEFNCWNELKRNNTFVTTCQRCLPSCSHIEYSADTTRLPLRDDIELWSSNSSESRNWTRDKVAIVHVFFGKDQVEARVRRNLYDVSEVIANAGGLAGLQLGFSMMCLADPIYFILLKLRRMIKSKIQTRANRTTQLNGTEGTGNFGLDFLVNPNDFMRWADPYSKDPKNRPKFIPFPRDFIRGHLF